MIRIQTPAHPSVAAALAALLAAPIAALVPSCAPGSGAAPEPTPPTPPEPATITAPSPASAPPTAAEPTAPAAEPAPRATLQAAPSGSAAPPPAPPPPGPLACVAGPDPELDRESPWTQSVSRIFERKLPALGRCSAELEPEREAQVLLRFVYDKKGQPLSHHIIASPNESCGAARCVADALASIQAPELLIERGAYDLALILRPGAPPQRTADEHAGLAPDDAAAAPDSCIDPGARQLTRSKIDDVVRTSFDALTACYGRALERDHAASGLVTFELVIGRSGRVEMAQARDATLYDCPAIECMLSELSVLSFPPPLGRSVRVIYPIRYSIEQPPVRLR